MARIDKDLTEEDKREAFLRATRGYSGSNDRWKQRAVTGMTDEALAEVLKTEIGIYGGRCGPGEMAICFQGSGLKIWASWREHPNTYCDKPIFAGTATIRMAREVYGIENPEDGQMRLL